MLLSYNNHYNCWGYHRWRANQKTCDVTIHSLCWKNTKSNLQCSLLFECSVDYSSGVFVYCLLNLIVVVITVLLLYRNLVGLLLFSFNYVGALFWLLSGIYVGIYSYVSSQFTLRVFNFNWNSDKETLLQRPAY